MKMLAFFTSSPLTVHAFTDNTCSRWQLPVCLQLLCAGVRLRHTTVPHYYPRAGALSPAGTILVLFFLLFCICLANFSITISSATVDADGTVLGGGLPSPQNFLVICSSFPAFFCASVSAQNLVYFYTFFLLFTI